MQFRPDRPWTTQRLSSLIRYNPEAIALAAVMEGKGVEKRLKAFNWRIRRALRGQPTTPTKKTRVKRHPMYNVILDENDLVYASYALYASYSRPPVDSRCAPIYFGALFAKKDIPKHTVVAEYAGPEYAYDSNDTDVAWRAIKDTQYLMTRTSEEDGRKKIVVDGNPRWGGIGGYANYSPDRTANLKFVDRMEDKSDTIGGVYLVTSEDVDKGTELRVDYDMGSSGAPWLDRLKQTLPACNQDELEYPGSARYRALRYTTPLRRATPPRQRPSSRSGAWQPGHKYVPYWWPEPIVGFSRIS